MYKYQGWSKNLIWKWGKSETTTKPDSITFSDYEILEPKKVTAHWLRIPQFSTMPYRAEWMTQLRCEQEVEMLNEKIAADRPCRIIITSPDNNFFPCILMYEERVFISYGSLNNIMFNVFSFVLFLISAFRSGIDIYYGAVCMPTRMAIQDAEDGKEKRFVIDQCLFNKIECLSDGEVRKFLDFFRMDDSYLQALHDYGAFPNGCLKVADE